ncbi:MAG: hypothetical protein A3J48_00645 [Candidatus Doudnabacteria bacterium RIFCSPHIGHO2_02_FULL_46_11]|uniref:Metallo-beta-lactamase domain-containing protein n=1 Tax=Candidatus Doudnabacteria bacterium RIFCSPHIGHO2_02_FULL_46_11 TaxID=1817832 RepID=A0A1F5P4T1_9BACT|nr:MAG: hypothetical protein A3J48_00645 [Candidatus Doudnabacteria bacterium RIFCSPHIGHO2_02_FULL_46_11]
MVKWRLFVLCLALFTGLVAVSFFRSSPEEVFSFHVLDVGQGDALLIKTPDNIKILLDGGPNDNILTPLAQSLGNFDRRLDLLILTHPDADHLEGFIPVLKKYDVQMVLRAGALKTTAAHKVFEQVIKEKNVRDERLFMGDKIKLSDETEIVVLWPPEGELNEKEPNESSIVAQLTYKGYKFLLTGDIGQETEREIMKFVKPEFIRSHILKVPHHGSRFSSSSEFLEIVDPEVAVISVGGDNLYGHPTSEVLQRLEQRNAKILRTDLMSTISFTLKPEGLVVGAAD